MYKVATAIILIQNRGVQSVFSLEMYVLIMSKLLFGPMGPIDGLIDLSWIYDLIFTWILGSLGPIDTLIDLFKVWCRGFIFDIEDFLSIYQLLNF